jgi:enoyl-CoA hydratase
MHVDPITLSVEDEVAHLVLNRPPKNELGWSFFERLADLGEQVLPTLKVRGMILSGQGRHFSSGSDVSDLLTKASDGEGCASVDAWETNAWAVRALNRLPYPVVAAISGCCLGSGLELALACHYRVAAGNALLSLPETQLGLMPGCGGTVALSRLVGPSKALELIITGRFIDASEALAMGLLDQVVHRKWLLDAAKRIVLRPMTPFEARSRLCGSR